MKHGHMDDARKNSFFSKLTAFLARDLLLHNPAILDAQQAVEYAKELIVMCYIWDAELHEDEKDGDSDPESVTKH